MAAPVATLAAVLHVFFDLDGTLTDSAEGITRCLMHAVREAGGSPPERDALTLYIGTALVDIFAELLATDDAGTIERAVAAYQVRFRAQGIRENRLYPGVEAGLVRLHAAGHALHVATAKLQHTAEEVIELFSLGDTFHAVHGMGAEHRGDKGALLAAVTAQYGLDPRDCVMVGDRRHDIEAARRVGMRSVWAEWGYGTVAEREHAAPHHVVHAFDELVDWIACGADASDTSGRSAHRRGQTRPGGPL